VQRREFFRKLGIGAGVLALAPQVLAQESISDASYEWWRDEGSASNQFDLDYVRNKFREIVAAEELYAGSIVYINIETGLAYAADDNDRIDGVLVKDLRRRESGLMQTAGQCRVRCTGI